MKKIIFFALSISMSFAFAAKKDLPKVTLEKAQKTILERSLFFPVSIQSKVDSKIKSDGEFIILERLVSLGQKVKKGTPLLSLRHQDTSVHYEKRILRAPVSGVVANINVNQGQFVRRGEDLIHLNDPNNLYGKIEVSAADYKKIKQGLNGKLNLSSLGLKNIPVEVAGIGAAVDQLTGTVSVELNVKDQMDKLVPGVIGLAEITLNKEEKLLVKEKALYYIGEEVFIPVLNQKNKVKKIKVKLGKRYKEKIEITNGLDLGKEYIAEAAKFLRDGEKVEVNKPKKEVK